MYSITRTAFGVHFTFQHTVTVAEMQQWAEEAAQLLPSLSKSFGVLVDNRQLQPGGMTPDVQKILDEMQASYKAHGMQRSCVVLESAALALELEQAARAAGSTLERFLDASGIPDWEQVALRWIQEGIEPVVPAPLAQPALLMQRPPQ